MGVTGRHALWDAKSGVDRLFVSLASMYPTIKISTILSSFKRFTFHPSFFLYEHDLLLQIYLREGIQCPIDFTPDRK